MEQALTLLKRKEWRLIDQSNEGPLFSAMESFAMDDTLCTAVGAGIVPATARLWVHHATVVLGIQDTKLPQLKHGLDFLKKQGYRTVIRNSGGLAVLLDEGVLNISLIFPDTEKGIDINRGYDTMWALIRRMFVDFSALIEAKEIVGSYCPGSYDLSINGKKFAGISQRRIRKGVAVQIYLCVQGDGQKRAKVIQQFYEKAKKDASTKFTFPDVRPEVMASLSDLLKIDLTMEAVRKRFMDVLNEYSESLYIGQLLEQETNWYPMYYQRMKERNEKGHQVD